MRCEDARIQASTHEPEDMNLRTWRREDARKQASTHDVRKEANTYEPEDMKTWGCKKTSKRTWTWGYENARMQARVYELADMRM